MLNIEEMALQGQLLDDRYRLLRPLNTEGGTADVWLAVDTTTIEGPDPDSDSDTDTLDTQRAGLMVAIKIYRPKNALDIEGERRFKEEFKIVYNCHHANLIQPTHFSIYRDTPYLVLPYCSFGSSELLIGQLTDVNEQWRYIGEVAAGLDYLHNNKPPIVHQDIKPANVLIDDNHNYAITDFGISARFGRRKTGGGHHYYYDDENQGTFAYMAPERFVANTVPDAPGDIWALGATVFELLTQRVPFGENGGQSQPDGPVKVAEQIKNTDADIRRLINDCLAKDPAKRPTAAQLVEAARQKTYPPKKRSKARTILTQVAIVLAVVVATVILWPGPDIPAPVEDYPERFAAARALTQSDNAKDVKNGIELMEELAKADYVPALYEMGRTYGCAFDMDSAVYNKRKRLLGIVMGNENIKQDKALNSDWELFPRFAEDRSKAVLNLTRMVELNDSNYNEMNMWAALTLAFHSFYCDKEYLKAKNYFIQARDYAVLVKNQDKIQVCDDAIIICDQALK